MTVSRAASIVIDDDLDVTHVDNDVSVLRIHSTRSHRRFRVQALFSLSTLMHAVGKFAGPFHAKIGGPASAFVTSVLINAVTGFDAIVFDTIVARGIGIVVVVVAVVVR